MKMCFQSLVQVKRDSVASNSKVGFFIVQTTKQAPLSTNKLNTLNFLLMEM